MSEDAAAAADTGLVDLEVQTPAEPQAPADPPAETPETDRLSRLEAAAAERREKAQRRARAEESRRAEQESAAQKQREELLSGGQRAFAEKLREATRDSEALADLLDDHNIDAGDLWDALKDMAKRASAPGYRPRRKPAAATTAETRNDAPDLDRLVDERVSRRLAEERTQQIARDFASEAGAAETYPLLSSYSPRDRVLLGDRVADHMRANKMSIKSLRDIAAETERLLTERFESQRKALARRAGTGAQSGDDADPIGEAAAPSPRSLHSGVVADRSTTVHASQQWPDGIEPFEAIVARAREEQRAGKLRY